MGLYGQRIGALSVVCATREEAAAVDSQLRAIARPMYSNPPMHGTHTLPGPRPCTVLAHCQGF